MTTFSFASSKGGVGKSTICILCARYLAALGKKVLCIDTDIQNSLTFYFLNERMELSKKNIVQAIKNKNLMDHSIKIHNCLSIIPSDISLRNLEEVQTFSIKNLLLDINDFDYCLIDCSPYLNKMSLSVLHASNTIISPLFLGQFEWKSSIMFKKDVSFYLGISHKIQFLVNRCSFVERNIENRLTFQYLELFKRSFKNNILETQFPEIRNLPRILDTAAIITQKKKFERLFISVKNLIQEIWGINETPKEF